MLDIAAGQCAVDGVVSAVKGPKTYKNDRGSGCYLSFDLTDGTETVRVVLFNEQVDKFKDLVDESSAIRIENPSVELRDEHYKRFYLL